MSPRKMPPDSVRCNRRASSANRFWTPTRIGGLPSKALTIFLAADVVSSLYRNILAPLAIAAANSVLDSFLSQRSCFFLVSGGSATQSVVAITVFRRACSPQRSLRARKWDVFPELLSSPSEWRKTMPVVRSPFWYLGTGSDMTTAGGAICAYCV